MKIYMPNDSTYNKCYVVQSEGVIRGYDRTPANNVSYNYRDYYIKSDYIFKDGTGTWSQYTTLPICLSNSIITNDFYYRQDITSILITFSILVIFTIYLPIKLFLRLVGGRH